MAKQAGPYYLTGCYDNICFYKLNGEYFARTKSSLKGDRIKKDPAFRETMLHADWMAKASKIASAVYKNVAVEKKKRSLYNDLTGEGIRLLKEGRTEREVCDELEKIANLI